MAVNPYELQRKRVSQETAATGAQENEALKRRFARQGGGMQGGAYIKAQERLSGVQEQNKQKALEGVDIQEAVAQEQKDESQRNRDFSTSERLGSQGFAAGESALGRRFASEEAGKGRDFTAGESEKARGWQSGEAKIGREFAAGESALGRAFAKTERIGSQDFANKTRAEAQDWQSSESLKTRNLQDSQFAKNYDLQMKQFGMDEDITKFNKAIAAIQLNVPLDQILAQIYGNKAPGGPKTSSGPERRTLGQVDFGGGS